MILFVDTETTGLPKNYKAPYTDINNWPRIAQIAFQVRKDNGEIEHEYQALIKPNGWKIPTVAELTAQGSKDPNFFENNNMSTERCELDGVDGDQVLNYLLFWISQCHTIVAHNLDFDLPIIQAELLRAGLPSEITLSRFCTCHSMTDICQLPGPYGFKWPKLTELVLWLGLEMQDAHDALNDTRACAECYFEIKKRNLLPRTPSGSLVYSNIQRYENMPWREYAALPGYSFSYLKREKGGASPAFVMTDKIRLGSLVDAILMQPEDVQVSDPLFPDAKRIASEILAIWGPQIKRFKCQMSYSGDIEYCGLKIRVKGRSDWELPGHCIVDLKVTTATNPHTLIEFMGYDNQQNNYSALAGVPVAYILAYNPKLRKCLPLVKLPYNSENQFWKEKILKFGTI